MKEIDYLFDIELNQRLRIDYIKSFIRYLKENHLYNIYKFSFENQKYCKLTFDFFLENYKLMYAPFSSVFSFKKAEEVFHIPITQFYVMENMFFSYKNNKAKILKDINICINSMKTNV